MKKKKIILLMLIFSLCIMNVSAMELIKCGGFNNVPAEPLELIGNVINIIKLLLPVIIIILGIIDLFKGITSQDDSKKSNGIRMFIKRLIYGVATFFVIAIVQFVFSLLDGGDDYLSCASCMIGNDCKKAIIKYDMEIVPLKSGEVNFSDFFTETGEIKREKPNKIKVTGIEITKKKSSMIQGESYTIKANVIPKDAANQKITYKSSKKSVATISMKGKITAKKAGTTTITAQSVGNKSKKATFKLTVSKK